MASYTDIGNNDIDPESPGNTVLFAALRDNIEALYENTRVLKWKAATEGPVEDDTYQNDDDIAFTILANEEWAFRMMLLVTTTAAADFKLRFTQTGAGASNTYASLEAFRVNALTQAQSFQIETGVVVSYAGVVTSEPLFVNGTFISGANPVVIQLQWAQGVNTPADDAFVLEGSFLAAHRMDDL